MRDRILAFVLILAAACGGDVTVDPGDTGSGGQGASGNGSGASGAEGSGATGAQGAGASGAASSSGAGASGGVSTSTGTGATGDCDLGSDGCIGCAEYLVFEGARSTCCAGSRASWWSWSCMGGASRVG